MAQEVRKDFTDLSTNHKERYIKAIQELHKTSTGGISDFMKYAEWHAYGSPTAPGDPPPPPNPVNPQAHNGPCFLPWHRTLLRLYELDLQAADKKLNPTAKDRIGLPYWNSVKQQGKKGDLWKNDMMGPNGSGSMGLVQDGPFKGWKNGRNMSLTRRIGTNGSLPTQAQFDQCVKNLITYDTIPYTDAAIRDTGKIKDRSMRNFLERNIHNGVHNWVGGIMGNIYWSPTDPVFFMHHCFIDFIWSRWQRKNPKSTAQYVSDTEIEKYRNSPPVGVKNPHLIKRAGAGEEMRPWKDLPAPHNHKLYVKDVLNWENITNPVLKGAENGYRYDADEKGNAKIFKLT